MKPSEFYTQNLYTEPNTGNILTDNLKNYNVDTFTDAYWLGWISWDNIPQYVHLSTYSVTPTNVTFYDVTKKQNSNIGYSANGPYNLGGAQYGDIAKKEANAHITSFNQMRFMNKLDIQSIGSRPLLTVFTNAYCESSTDGGETWTKYGVRQIGGVNINGFDFLFNDAPLAISVQPGYGGNHETFLLKFSEIGDDNVWWFERPGEYQGVTYLNRFGISIYNFYITAPLRDMNANGNLANYIGASPFIDLETENYKGFTSFTGVTSTYGTAEMRLASGSGTPQTTGLYNANLLSNFGLVPGGYNFSVPVSWTAQNNYPNALYSGNALLWHRSSYIQVFRVLTKDEIQKTFCLQPYFWANENVSRTYGYSDGLSYVSYVTDENEFTATLITGELADDEFKDKLRPWQYNADEWELNEYTEDDKPEYEPPTPEDVPDAFGADSIPDLNFSAGAISNFITMYCLTEQQVANFGAYLWANIFSADFLKSIGTIIVNDFSVNPADILNYFISLRKYPFDLYGKTGYEFIAQGDLYFGRGVAGIPIQGAFGKMQSLGGTFGGEYIEVPALYNDFRDYEPYARISVFVPFCGSLEVTPSEVVGKRIFITYTVDYSTGNIQADVWVQSDVAFILGTLTGQVGATIQMTASNNMEVIQKVGATAMNFVKTAASVAAIAATGGAAAEAGMAGEITATEATAKELGAVSSMAGATSNLSNAPVVSSNPIHSSSTGSGFASFATPRARLLIERRKYTVPSNYNHVYGKAVNKTVTLSSLQEKGFTVCKNVDLSGIPATQDELIAIESLLTSGVYF